MASNKIIGSLIALIVLAAGVYLYVKANLRPETFEMPHPKAREMLALAGQIERFKSECGDYPETGKLWASLSNSVGMGLGCQFKIEEFDSEPLPYGVPYVYERTESGFTILTLGSDHKAGGNEDENSADSLYNSSSQSFLQQ